MVYLEWKEGDLARGYVRIKKIYEGGLGRVYIGFCSQRQIDVVIKTIKEDLWERYQLADCWAKYKEHIINDIPPSGSVITKEEYFYYIFFREARLTCQAHGHPALVRGFNIWWTDEGQPFYECEYVKDALPLSEFSRKVGKSGLGVLQLVNLAIQFCNGMIFITEEMLRSFNEKHPGEEATGFVHRDIKPANLLLDRKNQIKIIDLGLAKFVQHSTLSHFVSSPVKAYTPLYASPEQLTSQEIVEPSSDIYSFGATLFKLAGGDILQLGHMVQKGRVEYPKHLPTEFCQILNKCLQEKPALRYQDFRELKEVLVKFIKDVKEGHISVPDGLYCGRCGFIWSKPGDPKVYSSVSAPPTGPGEVVFMKFVTVPGGPFWKGCREDHMQKLVAKLGQNPYEDEKYQEVNLPVFEITKYTVTNRQYFEFVRTTGYERIPSHWTSPVSTRGMPFPEEWADLPVVNVSFYDAEAYCRWAGCRLPTGDEWEKAARGTDGRLYPWGNEYDSSFCNSAESGRGRPVAVNDLPQGQSPYGCFHMTGNVMEWVKEPHPKTDKYCYLRGGCWTVSCEVLGVPFFHYVAASKDATTVGGEKNIIGFRCVRDKKDSKKWASTESMDNSLTGVLDTETRFNQPEEQEKKRCPVCGGEARPFDIRFIKIPEKNLFTWRGFFDLL